MPRADTFAALRHRNFRLLWVSLLVSNSGTWLQSVAQDYVVYKLTGRALDLGFVNIVRAVPLILLAFVGGTIADRVDRRKMLLFTQTAFALLAGVLGVLVQTGRVQVWHVIVLSFLGATLLAFDQPARQSLLPSLVPKEDLANAIALNSITYTGAAAIGPAIAGPLVALVGLPSAFYLNGLSFGAVLFAVAAMRLPAPPPRKVVDPARESVGQAITSGLRYVAASPPLLLLVSLLCAFSFFAAPYQTLLPVFNGRVFASGDVGSLGWLRAAPGLGALLGGFYLARGAQTSQKPRLVFVGGIGFCAAILLFSWSNPLPVALGVLLVAGALSTVFTSTVQTLLQRLADERMRGRVMSLFTICVLGMWPLGALPLSWVSDHFGVRAAVSGGAAIAALLIVTALWRARRAIASLPS
ncbi:MAG: MFS transporter [Cytophagales bacterium]|nr:MFS transporter [Armatimonadota bacterium]